MIESQLSGRANPYRPALLVLKHEACPPSGAAHRGRLNKMRAFSRNLPPVPRSKTSVAAWICLAAFVLGLAVWVYFKPVVLLFLGGIIGISWFSVIVERRRIRKIASRRSDTICEFGRSFDRRKIDPWIIRATHEELGKHLDSNFGFPLRADDNFEKDLKIDGEDLDDIANDVAARIGYDMASSDQNPFFGKVKTVRDFVMFFTHEPQKNKANRLVQ